MKTILITFLLLGSLAQGYSKAVSKGEVQFAESKTDFARLEKMTPLTAAQRNAIMPDDLRKMNQEEIEQLYGRLSSGPIPTAAFQGQVLMKAEAIERLKKMFYQEHQTMTEISRKVCGVFSKPDDPVECLAEILWRGKAFYKPNQYGEVELRNAIPIWAGSKLISLFLPPGKDWLAEAPQKLFFGSLKFMLFPAKVFCGQSLLDSRKESIVIDYAHGDDFSPFIEGFDDLAGRKGFDVRDEVRMIRPGFYLGRAYMGKIFVLNFTLYNPDLAKEPASDASQDACFIGKTTRQ